MTRPQMIFLSLLGLGFGFLLGFTRPPACADPAGCSWFPPGASVLIGVERISSGPGSANSQAVLQAAAQAAEQVQPLEGHPLRVQPVDTNCLPGSPDLAANAIAGAPEIIAALGPVCRQDPAAFSRAIRASARALIPSLPEVDREQAAQEAVDWLGRLQVGAPVEVSALSEEDQAIAELICQELVSGGRACLDANTAGADPAAPAAAGPLLIVSWTDSLTTLAPFPVDSSGRAVIILSLSRPRLPDPTFGYRWIGPKLWVGEPQESTQTTIDSISGLAARAGVGLVARALQKTRETRWDGSWILPRQAFFQAVTEEMKTSPFFQGTTASSDLSAKGRVLTAFQVRGVEYNDLYP